MIHENLHHLLDLLITGEITEQDHGTLQSMLKHDADARAIFRERMDLEAGLQTWAAEPALFSAKADSIGSDDFRRRRSAIRWAYPAIGIAVTLLLGIGLLGWKQFFSATPSLLTKNLSQNPLIPGPSPPQGRREQGIGIGSKYSAPGSTSTLPAATDFVGYILQPESCEWRVQPVLASGRFGLGKLELIKGLVELRFDSGTNIIFEGPCELDITSIDSALLKAGDVCVNVGELSNGFTLTTPDSKIIDEGTEYAVSLTSDSTEVHVFDGSVIWIPTKSSDKNEATEFKDRVEAGEAKSYSRAEPTKARKIPFGQRQFVRRLEDAIKEKGGKALLVYDGFENLAGRLRRGRSGFGWTGGWEIDGRGRSRNGEIVDCPEGMVFGFDRSQRRLMLVEKGTDIRRNLEQTLELVSGESIYVGVMFARKTIGLESDGLSLQISLEPDLPGRGRRLHQNVSFGVATDGFPFVQSGNRISKTAAKLETDETVFCALKLTVGDDATNPFMRIYRASEVIEKTEPSTWTVTGAPGSKTYSPASIRISAGENIGWEIDELKIGKSWQSIQTNVD